MSKRILGTLLSLLVIVSMLLVACGSATEIPTKRRPPKNQSLNPKRSPSKSGSTPARAKSGKCSMLR